MTGIPHASVHPRQNGGALLALAVVGLGLTAAAIVSDPTHGWAGVLTAGMFGITIALGGALFSAIFTATGATWWKPLRGVPLAIAGTIAVPAAAIAAVVALGVTSLYPWADPEIAHSSHVIHGKLGWLDRTFFSARAAVILLVWLGMIAALRRKAAAREPLVRMSIFFLVVFALTISVATWDWTMSLEPEWYSTMYAVYGFAGAIHAGIAATALWALRKRRSLGSAFGTHQVHTLSSLLFAFSFFWGYIWFCQAMLIWYANIPEETLHFAHRFTGGWSMLFWLNPVLNLAIPFVALLSTAAKRNPAVLVQVALVVLVGHWLDVFLLIGPGVGESASVLPYAALGATATVVAAMVYLLRHDRRALA